MEHGASPRRIAGDDSRPRSLLRPSARQKLQDWVQQRHQTRAPTTAPAPQLSLTRPSLCRS